MALPGRGCFRWSGSRGCSALPGGRAPWARVRSDALFRFEGFARSTTREQKDKPASDLARLKLRESVVIKGANKQLLTRREFNRLCRLAGLSLPAMTGLMATMSSALDLAATDSDLSTNKERTVKFTGGTAVPAVGQGSWHLAQEDTPKQLRRTLSKRASLSAYG
jgi:hypothetical protein